MARGDVRRGGGDGMDRRPARPSRPSRRVAVLPSSPRRLRARRRGLAGGRRRRAVAVGRRARVPPRRTQETRPLGPLRQGPPARPFPCAGALKAPRHPARPAGAGRFLAPDRLERGRMRPHRRAAARGQGRGNRPQLPVARRQGLARLDRARRPEGRDVLRRRPPPPRNGPPPDPSGPLRRRRQPCRAVRRGAAPPRRRIRPLQPVRLHPRRRGDRRPRHRRPPRRPAAAAASPIWRSRGKPASARRKAARTSPPWPTSSPS